MMLISCKKTAGMCIIASSIIGGYLLMRGISLFIGAFPNEYYLLYFLKGEPYAYYYVIYEKYSENILYISAYILSLVIFVALGIIYQNKRKSQFSKYYDSIPY